MIQHSFPTRRSSDLAGFGFDASVLTTPEIANAGPLFVLGSPGSPADFAYGGDSDMILKALLVVVLLANTTAILLRNHFEKKRR